MDAVTHPDPADPPSAQIIDLAAWRRARGAARAGADMPPADPFPWAYTFRGPEPVRADPAP